MIFLLLTLLSCGKGNSAASSRRVVELKEFIGDIVSNIEDDKIEEAIKIIDKQVNKDNVNDVFKHRDRDYTLLALAAENGNKELLQSLFKKEPDFAKKLKWEFTITIDKEKANIKLCVIPEFLYVERDEEVNSIFKEKRTFIDPILFAKDKGYLKALIKETSLKELINNKSNFSKEMNLDLDLKSYISFRKDFFVGLLSKGLEEEVADEYIDHFAKAIKDPNIVSEINPFAFIRKSLDNYRSNFNEKEIANFYKKMDIDSLTEDMNFVDSKGVDNFILEYVIDSKGDLLQLVNKRRKVANHNSSYLDNIVNNDYKDKLGLISLIPGVVNKEIAIDIAYRIRHIDDLLKSFMEKYNITQEELNQERLRRRVTYVGHSLRD